jgi:hypothetical protein
MKLFLPEAKDLIDNATDAIMQSHPDYHNLKEDEGWDWNADIGTVLEKLIEKRDNCWRTGIEKQLLSMARKSGFKSAEMKAGWVEAIAAINLSFQSPAQQKLLRTTKK